MVSYSIKQCKQSAHHPSLGLEPISGAVSLWCMASATPDTPLPPQLYGITAITIWRVPNQCLRHTVWTTFVMSWPKSYVKCPDNYTTRAQHPCGLFIIFIIYQPVYLWSNEPLECGILAAPVRMTASFDSHILLYSLSQCHMFKVM